MAKESRRALPPYRRFEGLVLSSQGKRERARVRDALARAGLQGWNIVPLALDAMDGKSFSSAYGHGLVNAGRVL